MQLEDLFKLQCVKLMFKKIHNTLHSYHTSKLLTNYEITQTNTRQKDNINIDIQNNTNLSKMNSINYKVGTAWNELDQSVKEHALQSLPTFTRNVRKWYISKYKETCNIDHCYTCNS